MQSLIDQIDFAVRNSQKLSERVALYTSQFPNPSHDAPPPILEASISLFGPPLKGLGASLTSCSDQYCCKALLDSVRDVLAWAEALCQEICLFLDSVDSKHLKGPSDDLQNTTSSYEELQLPEFLIFEQFYQYMGCYLRLHIFALKLRHGLAISDHDLGGMEWRVVLLQAIAADIGHNEKQIPPRSRASTSLSLFHAIHTSLFAFHEWTSFQDAIPLAECRNILIKTFQSWFAMDFSVSCPPMLAGWMKNPPSNSDKYKRWKHNTRQSVFNHNRIRNLSGKPTRMEGPNSDATSSQVLEHMVKVLFGSTEWQSYDLIMAHETGHKILKRDEVPFLTFKTLQAEGLCPRYIVQPHSDM